jgi:hypothetical protein
MAELKQRNTIMTNHPEKPIDNVRIDNLGSALRMCGVELSDKVLDLVIDLVELIEDKGADLKLSEVVEIRDLHKSKNFFELEPVIQSMRESTFHHTEEEAKLVINEYLQVYPQLLEHHPAEWYYRYC